MTAGFVLKPKDTIKLKETFLKIKKVFESRNIEVLIDSVSAKAIGLLGVEFNDMCEAADFLVALGGDGTLISLARRSYKFNKPILGINAGNLGFLTDINPDNIEEFIDKFLKGEYRIDERMVIEVEYKDKKLYAFNDIVISKEVISSMIHIRVDTNESYLNTYYGDGLIVSTPTGSTAYNLSAGGPVVYPLTEGFVLTPICPHSLTQRPLILPSNFVLEIEVKENFAKLVIDGQEIYNLDEKIKVKKALNPAKLIHRVERNYFDVLRKKLHWGDGK
ncbi:NAD(+)/NADH kinase [Caminibacter pacificus]|uniref:NAD kinase n=1 Tax=Caminibacter pacificus TaxID=1424653 RepID=A0AAJ4UYK9_9BACT|nr:NAD(+)/NADH kinase [Caminibacter pacificus]NPA88557.1 NAD(+) kinase [Campylobacterota bacterium]QCI28299.1 NAD(+) kinase [Caminibacter pacificus]ROR40987.1 NAD+ kinase [Caminibacter pacificus]